MKFCPLSMIGDNAKECYREKCTLWDDSDSPRCILFSFFHSSALSQYKYWEGMERADKMQSQINEYQKPDDKDVV